jgi:hypothetical protein
MPPPYVAIVNRSVAVQTPQLAPSQLNERLLENISPQKAPDPPRYGDTPARRARQPMYAVLAMRQIRAVMHDGQAGVLGKTEFQQYVSSPDGKSLTWDERSNLIHQIPTPYGSQFQNVPQMSDTARLRSLLRI